MRPEIKPPYDEKLLKLSAQMNMSPSQFLEYLLDSIEVQTPKQEKIVINKPVPKISRKKVNPGWNVSDY